MKLFEIGQMIKELRKEKGITQEQLAKNSAISRVTLGKLERGQMGSVSIKTLDIILNALDYEIDFSKKDKYSFGLPTLDEFK
ncbi:helix-turn-helix domain-containing protein [Candidatus Sulfurimonas baltica]|uniref:helix-turn-helix domain-containing protein n=1 Tax=Candidatus Sulfurimonas baltica TaxID=2740404 RepID=UPI001E435167|nr:helix-turn-helix transcriptional regulator [Candidatus Sulfurimonas baltica]